MLDIESTFAWSSFIPLFECWRRGEIPREPGLYRIRTIKAASLDYVGQTGVGTMTLRKRMAMLAGSSIAGGSITITADHIVRSTTRPRRRSPLAVLLPLRS